MRATNTNNLFSHLDLVPEHKMDPAFKALRDSKYHAEARQLINNIYNRMGDPNGNFVKDFQLNGFHARLFEVACFAYLDSLDIVCDRSYGMPDFMASKNGITAAIEAVTANPSDGKSRDISIMRLLNIPHDEMKKKCENEFLIRMANSLEKKIRHKYWELEHCSEKPLVFMIAPYFEPGSLCYIDESLAVYLYGIVDEHIYNGRKVTSGFFDKEGSRYVSAVIYCNQFTVPRFFRMSANPNNNKSVITIREGFCLHRGNNSLLQTADYQYVLGDTDVPVENWWQGVTIFLNPNAVMPLPEGFLRSTSTFKVENDYIVRIVHDFHPLTSMMYVYCK